MCSDSLGSAEISSETPKYRHLSNSKSSPENPILYMKRSTYSVLVLLVTGLLRVLVATFRLPTTLKRTTATPVEILSSVQMAQCTRVSTWVPEFWNRKPVWLQCGSFRMDSDGNTSRTQQTGPVSICSDFVTEQSYCQVGKTGVI